MPDIADIHVNRPLTNLSLAYRNRGLIADQVFPVINVVKHSDDYWIYGAEAFRTERTLRAPRTAAPVISWGVTRGTYETYEHALSDRIDDSERENSDLPQNLDVDSTNIITDKLLLGIEVRVRDILTDTGVWANSSPGTKWDATGATPIADITEARTSIIMARANTMVISLAVYEALKQSSEIMGRILYSERGVITLDLLKTLFEIPNILIGEAVYDTAPEGQNPDIDVLWGDDVWLGYVTPSAGLRQISAGYCFRSKPMQARKWREEAQHSDAIEVGYRQGEEVVCAEVGVLLTDVLT